jgi:hypothetical protein
VSRPFTTEPGGNRPKGRQRDEKRDPHLLPADDRRDYGGDPAFDDLKRLRPAKPVK